MMADRVPVFENPETGELIARLPGQPDWQAITPDELEILQESGPEALISAAGNSVKQAWHGSQALISGALGVDELAQAEQGALDQTRRAQELRSGESPIAGNVGALAPDLALGAVTGMTGTVAKRMAVTGAIEGALGAARNPENPVEAGMLQGAIGAGAIGLGAGLHPVASRMQSSIRGVAARVKSGADDVPGIYRTAEGDTGYRLSAIEGGAGGAGRYAGGGGQAGRGGAAGADITRAPDNRTGTMGGSGFIGPEEMVDRYQYPLSEPQARLLQAWQDGDEAGFQAARRDEIADDVRSRTSGPMGIWDRVKNGPATDRAKLDEEQRFAMKRNVATEIGRPDLMAMDTNAVGENLERISRDISGIIEQSGPVRTKPIVEQWQALLDRRPNGAAANELRSWIKELSDMPAYGANPREVAQLRNQISAAMEWAGRNEPEPRALETMGAARQMLDQELKKKWTPEMQETFEELGYQWKLSQALVRGAKGAINDRGDVNAAQFMNNWRMLDNMVRTGRDRDNPFLGFMKSAAMATMKEVPNSGTPTGIASMLAGMAGDAALGAMGPVGGLIKGAK
jgi:hypothetical protein